MKSYFRNTNYFPALLKFKGAATLICILLLLFSTQVLAQIDTIFVPSDIPPAEGNLNESIKAHIGNLSNLVFDLEPYGYYILTDSIVVPEGEHLTIVAQEPGNTQQTAPPQIIWNSGWGVGKKYIFKVFGDLTLKNVWLMYANTDGWQIGSSISFIRDPLNVDKQYGNFEGVIFDYSPTPQNASGAVSVESNMFIGIFKNCYWKNCTDTHLRYYGRAVSFPYNTSGYNIDSLIFENCTFANIGYVYSQEKLHPENEGNYVDYLKFNHCTFFNVMMYSLESGWWNKLAVTNCLFTNTFMYGTRPIDGPEFYGGTMRIDSLSAIGFDVPFIEEERHILFTNSSYYIENWLSDWMMNSPEAQYLRDQGREDEIPMPQPMLSLETIEFFKSSNFPYMNMDNLYDSINPSFVYPPSNIESIKEFLNCKWCCGCDTDWSWKPENSFNRLWPLEEDISYTNETLLTAGMGQFPLGDLYHWWPQEYSQWKQQEEAENSRISYWLNTGIDSIFVDIKDEKNIINKFELLQNYPNPFNPTTNIEFEIEDSPRETSGLVTLKVFDVLGKEVATLVNEEKNPGKYEVKFDASKYNLSSGIYFYQLKSGNFIKTKKLILIK